MMRHFPERTEKAVTVYVTTQPTTKLQLMCKHTFHGSMQHTSLSEVFQEIITLLQGKDDGATTFAVKVK